MVEGKPAQIVEVLKQHETRRTLTLRRLQL